MLSRLFPSNLWKVKGILHLWPRPAWRRAAWAFRDAEWLTANLLGLSDDVQGQRDNNGSLWRVSWGLKVADPSEPIPSITDWQAVKGCVTSRQTALIEFLLFIYFYPCVYFKDNLV